MVGVPRSKACQTCLQRRVKCDLTRPECLQCTRRSTKCPGYEKRWKFLIETTVPSKKARRTIPQKPLDQGRDPATPEDQTIDECVAPNLVVQAFDIQGKETFCSFLTASFPAQFASCGGRVDVNWIQYARQPILDAPQALTWAFRSLATLHIGRTYHDSEKITSSRHMYSRALSYLSDLIGHPRYVRGSETLATAILLNIYEMQDGVSPLSWLGHARGLATLLQLRGPEFHRNGFGTTLLKSCRSLLVAEAFVRGGQCFLDQPEWQEFLTDVVEAESRSAKGSQLGILVDRAFIEISCCPRWLMETRSLLGGQCDISQSESISPSTLIQTMAESKQRLFSLQQLLEIGLSRQSIPDSNAAWEQFIGPIAVNFLGTFAQSALNGMRLAIALLDHLLELVRVYVYGAGSDYDDCTTSSSLSDSPSSFIVNPWAELGSNPVSWEVEFDPDHGLGYFSMTRETPGWMDRMMMSMGMLGIRPRELL
ncbi:hypothetical protein BJX99DRAFT_69182 [Aspergillus californicus]